MFKTLSAAALSLALAVASLSASATPARAGDDLAKFLFGAVALGIIAKGIADANDDNNRSTVTVNRNNQRPHYNYHHNNRYQNDRYQNDRPRAQRIPAHCARQARLGHGGRVATIYGRPCLRRNGIRTANADACSRTGFFNGRNVTYYTTRCLRRNGYRF